MVVLDRERLEQKHIIFSNCFPISASRSFFINKFLHAGFRQRTIQIHFLEYSTMNIIYIVEYYSLALQLLSPLVSCKQIAT